MKWYEKLSLRLENKAFKLSFWTTIFVLIGGLVEIPPFFMQGQIQKIDSVTPYNALELAGRDVYQTEGCFYCHTQLIRPFKWETDRWDRNRDYGLEPYSKAGEFVYDHPFLWGSKRTGPDLAHEASLNNNPEWHKRHLIDPQGTMPGSVMPPFAFLFKKPVDVDEIKANMRALRTVGVPYTDKDINKADTLLKGQTQGDALVAYLMKLGKDTMIAKDQAKPKIKGKGKNGKESKKKGKN